MAVVEVEGKKTHFAQWKQRNHVEQIEMNLFFKKNCFVCFDEIFFFGWRKVLANIDTLTFIAVPFSLSLFFRKQFHIFFPPSSFWWSDFNLLCEDLSYAAIKCEVNIKFRLIKMLKWMIAVCVCVSLKDK